jgi:hypothetical protein
MNTDAERLPWDPAAVRIERAVRGLPPLPESLEEGVVAILNSVVVTARELVIELADAQPSPGFEPFEGQGDIR